MKKNERKLMTVPASYEILADLDSQSLATRIERCGRVCYKSESKITPDSSYGFCQAMIKHKHNSVLEMGVVSLFVSGLSDRDISTFMATDRKYITVDKVFNCLLVTGSVRAFRESCALNQENFVWQSMFVCLLTENPELFSDIIRKCSPFPRNNVTEKISIGAVDQLPRELHLRHRHIAVRFIVNRAVTHEIVRHRPCAFLQESQRYCRYGNKQFGGRVAFIEPMFFKEGSEEYHLWEEVMLFTEEKYLKLLETTTPQAARTVLPNSCKTELIVYASLQQWGHIFHMRAQNKAAEPSVREVMVPLCEEMRAMFPKHCFDKRVPEGYV